MHSETLELTTENTDRIQLTPIDGGLVIQIFPIAKLPGQTAYDIFEIGLRNSTVKKLLLTLQKGGKYSTDYYQSMIWRDKSGKIHFHNKTNIQTLPEYNCILDVEQSNQFIRLVSYLVNGLPAELSDFTHISDGNVQHQLMQVVENPGLLNSSTYWDNLGMSLGTAGHFEPAMKCFHKALELNSEHHISKLNMAVNFDAMGNTAKALEIIEQVPDSIGRKNVIMANTLCSAGRELEAIPYYEKAIAEEPEFFLPYLRLLKVMYANNHPLFEFWLETALQTHRNVPIIAHFYTDLLLQQQRMEELAKVDWLDDLQYTSAHLGVIGKNSDDPVYIRLTQLNQKIALIYIEGDDQALPWTIDQLSLIPEGWNICTQSKLLVAAAVQSGHPELIPVAYEHICTLCKENELGIPRYLDTLLAKGYENQGNWDQAITYCERVLATDPRHLETLHIYYWNLDNADRVEDAIRSAEFLYSLDPSQIFLPYNIGFIQGKVGQFGKAEFYYLRQVELEPEHWEALENLSFIQLLSGKLHEAKATFQKSLDLRRKDFLDMTPFITPEEIEAGEDIFQEKSQKFSLLVEKALKLQGDSTYALQLQKLNMAGEVRVGANTAIERNPYSMDNILAMLGSANQADQHEGKFELALQARGDYSLQLAELLNLIPRLYELPKEAQSALVEGEKRFSEQDRGDFFLVIVAFSKALEVCVKKLVFDPFRLTYQHKIELNKQGILANTKLPREFNTFVSFIEKGGFVTLGQMAFVLKLLHKSETKGISYTRLMREYLMEQRGFQVLLVPETVEKITTLTNDYRNKAVHSAMFDRENARIARGLVIAVISSLASE